MKKLLMVLCAVLLFSGCMKTETELFINKDGSAVIKNNFLIAEELDNLSEQAFSKEIDKAKGEKDVKIEKIRKDGMVGTQSTINIKDITKEGTTALPNNFTSLNPDKKLVNVQKGIFKNKYTINLDINMSDAELEQKMAAQQITPEQLDAIFKVAFIAHLPVKADENNAQSANDETFEYRWDMKFSQKTPVKLVYTIYNTANIALAVLLVVVGLILLFIFAKPKEEEKEEI